MNIPHDPHRRPGVHYPEELSAHLLGLLDPVQSYAVEEHLTGCPACRREWEELRGMVNVLHEVPPEAFLDGPPDADLLLRRTLRQVRKEGSAQRRRRWFAVTSTAAVGLTVVLAGGVYIGQEITPRPPVVAAPAPGDAPAPGEVVLSGDGDPGVSMTATITPAAGWVRLSTSVRGIPPGERCNIVVVADDGTRWLAGSWVVGSGPGAPIDGSTLVPLDQIEEVVVENEDGHQFATARA